MYNKYYYSGSQFKKILRQSYDNLTIIVQNAAIIKQTYNNVNYLEILS